MTEEPRLHKPSGFFWAPLPTYSSYMYSCIALYFGKIKMKWNELNASLIFELRATWNFKRVTANYSLQFAVSHEKSDAKGLYWLTRLMQLAPSKGIRIRACGKFFACWIGNPGPWNPECHWQLESGIQVSLKKIWNLVTGILNPRRGIQTPRMSWRALTQGDATTRKSTWWQKPSGQPAFRDWYSY